MARRSSSPSITWESLLRSRLFLIGCIALLLAFLVGLGREIVQRYEINQQIRSLQTQIDTLQQRKTQLSDLIQYFSSPLFQEQEARQKLGLAKAGEHVVIVPLQDGGAAATNAQSTEAPQQHVSNPAKWWRYFFPPS